MAIDNAEQALDIDSPDAAVLDNGQIVRELSADTDFQPASSTAESPSRHRLAKFAARTLLIAGLSMGGAVAGFEQAPGVHIDAPGFSAQLHAPVVGSDVMQEQVMDHTFTQPTMLPNVLGKRLGARADVKLTSSLLINNKGQVSIDNVTKAFEYFSDPKIQRGIEWQLEKQDFIYSGGGAGVGLGIGIGSLLLINRWRRKWNRLDENSRQQIQAYAGRIPTYHKLQAVMLASSLAASGNAISFYASPNSYHHLRPDSAFVDTPLAGTDLEGPFKNEIDAAAPLIITTVRTVKSFQKKAGGNLEPALKAGFGDNEQIKDPNITRYMVLDDIEGTFINEATYGDAARKLGVDQIIISGDTSTSGSIDETFTINTLRSHIGSIPVFFVKGRHDSDDTATLARRAKMQVANDHLQTLPTGKTILGYNDPWRSPMGGAPYLIDPHIDTAQAALNAVDEACKTHPFFFAVHDNAIGNAVAQSRCATIVLDGRDFNMPPIKQYGSSYEITNGSSGGHGKDGLETGIPHNKSSDVIVDVNKVTGDITVRVIQIKTNAEVKVVAPEFQKIIILPDVPKHRVKIASK